MATQFLYEPTWERMALGVELVNQRLDRSFKTLETAGILYAVVGGNAVINWVSRVDVGAVRHTKDVDILINRSDLPAVIAAMHETGFEYAEVAGVHLFVDGPNGKPSQGVHLLFAGEKVKPTDPVPTPDLSESEPTVSFRVINLEALVRMKLVSNRRKDQVHIEDMLRVGLIDATWLKRYPPVLAERLQYILDTPDG